MQKLRRLSISMIVVILAIVCMSSFMTLLASKPVERVAFYPVETEEVLSNPYMGLVADARYDDSEQLYRLVHVNASWRELEPVKYSYDFSGLERKNNFSLWREKGVKLIFRITLDTPSPEEHKDIPDWLYEEMNGNGVWYDIEYGQGFSPDYRDPVLISNHKRLIEAIAERYNDDSLIAFVQLGSIGHWGEWHTHDSVRDTIPFPNRSIADQYVEHYSEYLTNKHLLMRRPHQIALDNQMGLYNDGFGDLDHTIDEFLGWMHEGYTSWLTGEKEPAMPDFWLSAPSGGEFLHETRYVSDPYIQSTLMQVRATHISWIGPQGPTQEEPAGPLQKNINRLLKTVGYRFVVISETHEKEASPGEILNIEVKVANRAVAPFYFDWPVELSLADHQGNLVVRQTIETDIRKWIPGEHLVHGILPLPDNLVPGHYTVCIAVLHPETRQPEIQFANSGLRPDGRYSLGSIIVNE